MRRPFFILILIFLFVSLGQAYPEGSILTTDTVHETIRTNGSRVEREVEPFLCVSLEELSNTTQVNSSDPNSASGWNLLQQVYANGGKMIPSWCRYYNPLATPALPIPSELPGDQQIPYSDFDQSISVCSDSSSYLDSKCQTILRVVTIELQCGPKADSTDISSNNETIRYAAYSFTNGKLLMLRLDYNETEVELGEQSAFHIVNMFKDGRSIAHFDAIVEAEQSDLAYLIVMDEQGEGKMMTVRCGDDMPSVENATSIVAEPGYIPRSVNLFHGNKLPGALEPLGLFLSVFEQSDSNEDQYQIRFSQLSRTATDNVSLSPECTWTITDTSRTLQVSFFQQYGSFVRNTSVIVENDDPFVVLVLFSTSQIVKIAAWKIDSNGTTIDMSSSRNIDMTFFSNTKPYLQITAVSTMSEKLKTYDSQASTCEGLVGVSNREMLYLSVALLDQNSGSQIVYRLLSELTESEMPTEETKIEVLNPASRPVQFETYCDLNQIWDSDACAAATDTIIESPLFNNAKIKMSHHRYLFAPNNMLSELRTPQDNKRSCEAISGGILEIYNMCYSALTHGHCTMEFIDEHRLDITRLGQYNVAAFAVEGGQSGHAQNNLYFFGARLDSSTQELRVEYLNQAELLEQPLDIHFSPNAQHIFYTHSLPRYVLDAIERTSEICDKLENEPESQDSKLFLGGYKDKLCNMDPPRQVMMFHTMYMTMCTVDNHCPSMTVNSIGSINNGEYAYPFAYQRHKCDKGYFCSSGLKLPCPTGFTCPTRGLPYPNRCMDLPTGNTTCFFEGTTEPQLCPDGSNCLVPFAPPIPAPPGYYMLRSILSYGAVTKDIASCDEGDYCALGREVETAENDDLLCPARTYCPTPAVLTPSICPCDQNNCSYCPPGRSHVEYCPYGFYCTEPYTKTECHPGQYCPLGSFSPKPCPGGYYCENPSSKEICPTWYYCRSGSISPKLCPIGSICPEGTSNDRGNILGISLLLLLIIAIMLIGWFFDGVREMVNRKLLSIALRRSAKKGRVHDIQDSIMIDIGLIDTDSDYSDWDSDSDDDDRDGVFSAEWFGSFRTRNAIPPWLRGKKAMEMQENPVTVFRKAHDKAFYQVGSDNDSDGESEGESDNGGAIALDTVTTLGTADISSKQMDDNKFFVDLAFHKMSLELSNGRKVLNNVSGELKASSFTAIMGCSGAGKSSFVTTLTDRATYGKRTGSIFINGKEGSLKKYNKLLGFVPQEDIMTRTTTVWETVHFAAQCKAQWNESPKKVSKRVDQILKDLGLWEVRNSPIGDEGRRGISGGQRKRVNVALELVANPKVLLLDEPTSGLDSRSSWELCCLLRSIAEKDRVNIMAVLHQPRYEIFTQCFTHCLLLGKGGRVCYLGKTEECIDYFESIGFPCPPKVNPSDHFLDVISGAVPREGHPDFKMEDLFTLWEQYANRKGIFTTVNDSLLARGNDNTWFPESLAPEDLSYTPQQLKEMATASVSDTQATSSTTGPTAEPLSTTTLTTTTTTSTVPLLEHDTHEENKTATLDKERIALYETLSLKREIRKRRSLYLYQLVMCMRRTVVQQLRDVTGILVEAGILVSCAFFLGLMFMRSDYVGPLPEEIVDMCPGDLRELCGLPHADPVIFWCFLIVLAVSLAGVLASLNVFGNEKIVHARESLGGLSSMVYFVGKSTVNSVNILIGPALFIATFYSFVSPRMNALILYAILLAVYYTGWGFGYLVSLLMKPAQAKLFGVMSVLILSIFSGSIRSVSVMSTLPLVMFLPWLSWLRYAQEALYLMEIKEYSRIYDVSRSLEMHGYKYDDLWWCILATIFWGILFRVLSLIVLKTFSENSILFTTIEMVKQRMRTVTYRLQVIVGLFVKRVQRTRASRNKKVKKMKKEKMKAG